MAAKKTNKSKVPEPTGLQRALRTAGWIALGLLVIAGIWGSIRVRDRVRGEARFRLEGWRLSLEALPPWVTPEIQSELEAIVLSVPPAADAEGGVGPSRPASTPAATVALESSAGNPTRAAAAPGLEPGRLDPDSEPETLFDRGVLDRVVRRIEASPWVRAVVSIRLTYPAADRPGVILAELQLWRPIALVESRGLYYLTDRQSRRLGSPYEQPPTEWFGIPTVVGDPLGDGDAPEPGVAWDSYAIQNGLEVARLLYDDGVLAEFAARPVEAIDVANVGAARSRHRSEISLLWEGRRLTWGRAPLGGRPRIIGEDAVIANLRQVLSRPGLYEGFSEIHLHRTVLTGLRRTSRPSGE